MSSVNFNLRIGPMRVSVSARQDIASRFEQRMRGFTQTAGGPADWTLDLLGLRPSAPGRSVVGRSSEVALTLTGPDLKHVTAALRTTPRSLARRMKRCGDVDHYREGRWSLLLRNAFELPALASLEYQYGYVPVHAATLSGTSGAVILLGPNGAGKSTLACELDAKLPLTFMSDNFTPCDGERVLSFPGAPRPKPGGELPLLLPTDRRAPLRAVVAVGFSLPDRTQERIRAFANYLAQDYDAHRGTGWADAWGGPKAASVAAANNQEVGRKLSALPYLSYDWTRDPSADVVSFVKEVVV